MTVVLLRVAVTLSYVIATVTLMNVTVRLLCYCYTAVLQASTHWLERQPVCHVQPVRSVQLIVSSRVPVDPTVPSEVSELTHPLCARTAVYC